MDSQLYATMRVIIEEKSSIVNSSKDEVDARHNNLIKLRKAVASFQEVVDGLRVEIKNTPDHPPTVSSVELSNRLDTAVKELSNAKNQEYQLITSSYYQLYDFGKTLYEKCEAYDYISDTIHGNIHIDHKLDVMIQKHSNLENMTRLCIANIEKLSLQQPKDNISSGLVEPNVLSNKHDSIQHEFDDEDNYSSVSQQKMQTVRVDYGMLIPHFKKCDIDMQKCITVAGIDNCKVRLEVAWKAMPIQDERSLKEFISFAIDQLPLKYRDVLRQKTILSLESLFAQLVHLVSPTKSKIHLQRDLLSTKRNPNEDVRKFGGRIEAIYDQIIRNIEYDSKMSEDRKASEKLQALGNLRTAFAQNMEDQISMLISADVSKEEPLENLIVRVEECTVFNDRKLSIENPIRNHYKKAVINSNNYHRTGYFQPTSPNNDVDKNHQQDVNASYFRKTPNPFNRSTNTAHFNKISGNEKRASE